MTNTVTLTLTQEQFQMVQDFFSEAEAKALSISEWTGETADKIADRFQVPHDSILEDMAEWEAAQRMGFSFS
jgi:hypothetical protein